MLAMILQKQERANIVAPAYAGADFLSRVGRDRGL
jgi:hypothetical protein